MTNAEKYKEVFGIEHPNCPTRYCLSCPMFNECYKTHSQSDELSPNAKWWDSDYKENKE